MARKTMLIMSGILGTLMMLSPIIGCVAWLGMIGGWSSIVTLLKIIGTVCGTCALVGLGAAILEWVVNEMG